MRLVFCGTPEFAVPSLLALLGAGHEVSLVLTQPDRPAGRGLTVQAPPVKQLAVERGLTVLQPERIRNNAELEARLRAVEPDAIVVVAYGRLIPSWMLGLPRFGNINVHGSLLPKYRGAAPVQWAVANGERETGVATMRLDEGLDTGDVFGERRMAIGPEAMAVDLFPQLADLGAELLLTTLGELEAGTARAVPQRHSEATLAPVLTREDGALRLAERTAVQAFDRWRGFYPWPGAHATFRGKRFLVHRMHPVNAGPSYPLPPGELRLVDGALWVQAAEGTALQLDEVQMEGKPRLAGAAFAKDLQVRPGERIA